MKLHSYVHSDCEGKRMNDLEIIGDAHALKKFLKEYIQAKCVNCGSVFGLYIYNEELWCPECLVARIHELESLLKEIWLEDSGHIGTIRKNDRRRFISTSTGYKFNDKTIDFTNGVEIIET